MEPNELFANIFNDSDIGYDDEYCFVTILENEENEED